MAKSAGWKILNFKVTALEYEMYRSIRFPETGEHNFSAICREAMDLFLSLTNRIDHDAPICLVVYPLYLKVRDMIRKHHEHIPEGESPVTNGHGKPTQPAAAGSKKPAKKPAAGSKKKPKPKVKR